MSTDPAYPGDFPDPFVLRVDSANAAPYYAFSTRSGSNYLQVMSSPDLHNWTAPSDALPILPTWAGAPPRTWAPEVLPRGDKYLMYYTVHERRSHDQCISLATAPATTAPLRFTDNSSRPLVCQYSHGGSIDPSPFVAPDGTTYLLWKSDDTSLGDPSNLWVQKLSDDGLSLVGRKPTRLLRATQPWQAGIIEGPSMYYDGGTYYLFYGANNYSSANAAIGYATCSSPMGSCTDRSTSGPWLGSHDNALGPSGPATFTDTTGTLKLAYHAWQAPTVGYSNGGVRDLWIDTLTFVDGRPTIP